MQAGGADFVMTVEQVAVYLHLAPSTVYKLAREERIPARKVGGRWRFSRRALDAWLAGERPPASAPVA